MAAPRWAGHDTMPTVARVEPQALDRGWTQQRAVVRSHRARPTAALLRLPRAGAAPDPCPQRQRRRGGRRRTRASPFSRRPSATKRANRSRIVHTPVTSVIPSFTQCRDLVRFLGHEQLGQDQAVRAVPRADQAADEVGFANQSHLTYHVARLVGVTPGRYLRDGRQPTRQQDPGKRWLRRAARYILAHRALFLMSGVGCRAGASAPPAMPPAPPRPRSAPSLSLVHRSAGQRVHGPLPRR